MRLEFSGVVSVGDEYRVYDEHDPGAIRIGNVDIVDAIAEEKFSDEVKVTLNGEEIANGRCVTLTGWGYSEYTPMESDSLSVGECDLIERLQKLVGQSVVLIVEDQ